MLGYLAIMQPAGKTPVQTIWGPNMTMKKKATTTYILAKQGPVSLIYFTLHPHSTRLQGANVYETQAADKRQPAHAGCMTSGQIASLSCSLSGFPVSVALVRPDLPSLLEGQSENASYSYQPSANLVAPSPCVCRHLGQLSYCLLEPLKLDYKRRENISYNRAVCPVWGHQFNLFSLSLFKTFTYF